MVQFSGGPVGDAEILAELLDKAKDEDPNALVHLEGSPDKDDFMLVYQSSK